MGKYDFMDKHYLERRVALADLLGAELYERCERFPPREDEVEFADPVFEKRFKGVMATLPPPDAPMLAFLCNLLDLEIDHEIEEIDRLVRSGADRACCPSAQHVETLHFLWRDLLHHMEERSMQMQDGFKRKDKHRIVASFRQRATLVQLAGPSDLH